MHDLPRAESASQPNGQRRHPEGGPTGSGGSRPRAAHRWPWALARCLIGLQTAAALHAEPPSLPRCNCLSETARRRAESIMARQYMYDCCDRTIAECLQDTPTCRLAVRLAESVCRRVAAGQDGGAIARGLSRRALSMTVRTTWGIDLRPDLTEGVGPDTAAVVVTVYACARCPFCAQLTPALYRETTEGRLRGRVRLYWKAFPIRSHPGSREANMALMAAVRLGCLWPYLLKAYGAFHAFEPRLYADWAREAGMDSSAFVRLMGDPGTAERLVECKKEGLRNGVEATPTFFINGRRYAGDLDLEELVDVLLEEADRVAGRTYVPRP